VCSRALIQKSITDCTSKFFGKPNGTNPPAKQSKLSFSTKPGSEDKAPSSSSSKENEDAEMKDEDLGENVKPIVTKVEKADGEADVKPEKGSWKPAVLFTY
jgi:DNA ligase-1